MTMHADADADATLPTPLERGILRTAFARPPATPFPAVLEEMLAGHLAAAHRLVVDVAH